jgi:hypothetical protein
MKFKWVLPFLLIVGMTINLFPQSRSTPTTPSSNSFSSPSRSPNNSGFSSPSRSTPTTPSKTTPSNFSSPNNNGFSSKPTPASSNKPISNSPSKPKFVQSQQTAVRTQKASEAFAAAKNPPKVTIDQTKSPAFNKIISTDSRGIPEIKIDHKIYVVERQRYYQNYQPPIYINNYSRSYGLWDALFMWSILDHMDHMTYYHHHQSPEWQNWRRDANTQAQQDPALAAKLLQLDNKVAALETQKVSVNPSYLPTNVKPEIVMAPNVVDQLEKPSSLFTCGILLSFLLLVMIITMVLIFRRKESYKSNYNLRG